MVTIGDKHLIKLPRFGGNLNRQLRYTADKQKSKWPQTHLIAQCLDDATASPLIDRDGVPLDHIEVNQCSAFISQNLCSLSTLSWGKLECTGLSKNVANENLLHNAVRDLRCQPAKKPL